jgi:hypothetical protein
VLEPSVEEANPLTSTNMRQLATLFCLAVLCVTSASAQWNLAQDSKASLTAQTVALYDARQTSTGVEVLLKSETTGGIQDEISIWRTGTGSTAYTLADAAAYDPTLVNMPTPAAIEAQCKAAVLKGLADGRQTQPTSGVTTTQVWYNDYGTARTMNFEIRWDAKGMPTVTRLPDTVATSEVK